MQRRLVKQGAATLMVSLPSKWCRQHSLDKGAEVTLEETGSELVISANQAQQKRSTELELTGLTESSIRTLITNTYRSGYDRITVSFQQEKQFQILHQIIKTRLIGFDVTEKKTNSCVVENITEPATEHFEGVLRKVFDNIHLLIEALKLQLQGKKTDESIDEIEERIHRYDNFCRRAAVKRGEHKLESLLAFFTLFIQGQRELYHASMLRVDASKRTIDLLDENHSLFKMMEEAYWKKNLKLLAKVHEREKELVYERGYAALEAAKGKEVALVHHIVTSTRLFYLSSSPLMGLLFASNASA